MERVIDLDVVGSTQDEVRRRLSMAPAGGVVVVRARAQREGRGRQGRRWQGPCEQGGAMLVSVGVREAPLGVLEQLPRRVVEVLHAAITPATTVVWKAPNDLVCGASGAKVAGVLIDVHSVGACVSELIVGVGCNTSGGAFTTHDGRAATTLAAVGAVLDQDAFISRLTALLTEPHRA